MLEGALLPVCSTVEPAVLALNNAHATELTWLDRDRLTLLLRQAFYARRIGEVDGFLWPSTRVPRTTARITCGFANASDGSSI